MQSRWICTTIGLCSVILRHMACSSERTFRYNPLMRCQVLSPIHLLTLESSQLVLYWCVVPFVYLIVSGCEHICLWTNRLSPVWVLVSSIVAIGAWILQVVLWSKCIGGSDDIPGFCPWVYREPWGQYPSWSVASPQGAQWAVPAIIALWVVPRHLKLPVSFQADFTPDTSSRWPSQQESSIANEGHVSGSPT